MLVYIPFLAKTVNQHSECYIDINFRFGCVLYILHGCYNCHKVCKELKMLILILIIKNNYINNNNDDVEDDDVDDDNNNVITVY